MNKKGFVSWSGGKDSCLALYKAGINGIDVKYLFTMMEDEKKSKSHGVGVELLMAQAEALAIPLMKKKATWDGYEDAFIEQLKLFKNMGIDIGIYGDIDLQGHFDWVERVSDIAGIGFIEPNWGMPRRSVVEELIEAGFKSKIVAVNREYLDTSYLGRDMTMELLDDFKKKGVDEAGECGEFHTFVYDGPIFREPVSLDIVGPRDDGNQAFLECRLTREPR